MTVSASSTTGGDDRTPAAEDLVNVTIDGVQVAVPQGTLVIRAAEQVGVEIPRFCDHPLLEPAGACRQCLVDIPDAGNGRGFPKPMASCTQPVAEGMVINTQATSAVADKAQQGQMEFLLINHPLDCPMCDKGGECPLQNQAMSNGRGESRFSTGRYPGMKRTFPKPINLSPNILLDRERCIVCQRCTRFADEIAGDPHIALLERGAQQQIGIAPGPDGAEREGEGRGSGHFSTDVRPWFDSYFAGNTIQICPVGALTSSQYRFRSRPFDLVSTPAVTEHDASGSAIRVDHRRGAVMRRMAGNDPLVNEEWITDKDRFAFTYAVAEDRLTYPQVRDEDGELRPASWPEAFVVAARGLRGAAASGGVGVLPGGRLIAEDAYAYGKFARVALGTNDVDFRARPHSAEEAEFLAARVALTTPEGGGVTFSDLESASTVVLVGLEPEDEAGAVFLRLRKAVRAGGTTVLAVAPYTTRGVDKLGARLVPTAPGEETSALADLGEEVDASSVLLVGERLATVPGALRAAADLADRTGARLAWVPRRAGDRGAVEAGCLPWLLPGGRPLSEASARVDVATAWGVEDVPDTAGRDGDAILAAAAAGQLGGLVIGGVDPADTTDPELTRAAIVAADFVVALELRETEVTRAADVVFPVAAVSEKPGSFVNWEGRVRPFEAALDKPGALPDLRVLAGISEEMGRPLGFRTVAGVRREMAQLGPWDGNRPSLAASEPGGPSSRTTPPARSSRAEGQSQPRSSGPPGSEAANERAEATGYGLRLSTWKLSLDKGSMQAGEEYLAATARPAVALLPQQVYDACGPTVKLTGDRGSVTLPAAVADLPEDVVWVPANSFGNGVLSDLASPGSRVRVSGDEGSDS